MMFLFLYFLPTQSSLVSLLQGVSNIPGQQQEKGSHWRRSLFIFPSGPDQQHTADREQPYKIIGFVRVSIFTVLY